MTTSQRRHGEWCSTLAARLLICLVILVVGRAPARAQLAPVPWPMLSHDLHHSGQSDFVGPHSVSIKWMKTIVGFTKSSPLVGVDPSANPTIYIGAAYNVCAIDAVTSLVHWCHQLPGNVRRNTAAIGVDGTIYMGDRANRLNAINPDGSLKWSYLVGNDGDVNTSPAIAPDGTIYMAGTFGGIVHAINPDGTLKWKVPSGSGISYISPAIGDDGTIYFGLGIGKIRAFNPDGTIKWDVNIGALIRFASPAIAADGTIYMGSRVGLTAVTDDTTTGTIRWTFPTAGFVSSAPAIAADGTIYVGSEGGHGGSGATLYALSPTGDLLWSYVADGAFRSSPAIGADGIIYVTAGNRVLAIQPDGTLLWQYAAARGLAMIASPAIGADGTLYVAGDLLYAFAP